MTRLYASKLFYKQNKIKICFGPYVSLINLLSYTKYFFSFPIWSKIEQLNVNIKRILMEIIELNDFLLTSLHIVTGAF